MGASALGGVAVEATLLQNGYALAVDSRDWDFFRTLFTPDVVAQYPHGRFDGVDAWLADFVPTHDGYSWSLHVMSTHVAGADDEGFWATCYGAVQWCTHAEPHLINRAEVLYRDRLAHDGERWRISRRNLDLVMREPRTPIPGTRFHPAAVADLTDRMLR